MSTAAQGSKPTVPLDSHSTKQQIKTGNLNVQTQETYASGREHHPE